MAQIDACQQGAGTAFLILGETVGSSLAVVCVVEDIVGVETIALALEAREDAAAQPAAQAIDVHRALVILAVIGLDKDA